MKKRFLGNASLDDILSLDCYHEVLRQRLEKEPEKKEEIEKEMRWAKEEMEKISLRSGIPLID